MTTRAHGSREKIKYHCELWNQEFQILIHGPQRKHVQGIQQTCDVWIFTFAKSGHLFFGQIGLRVQSLGPNPSISIIFHHFSWIFHHVPSFFMDFPSFFMDFPSFSIIFHGFLMISGRRNCTTASILDMPVINAPVSMRASASCDDVSHRLHWAEERQENIWKSIKHMGMGQNPGT